MEEGLSKTKEASDTSKTPLHRSAGCASLLATIVFPVAIGTGLAYAVPQVDEYLYPSVEEQVIEERLGKAVNLSLFDVGEERTKKVDQFDKVYRETRMNLDFFDQQFAQVGSIGLEKPLLDKSSSGTVYLFTNRLVVSYNKYRCLLDPEELVHELAHLWHEDLREKDQFEQQWYGINGTGYVGCNPLKNPFCRIDDWDHYKKAVAAPTEYGAINSIEHIAETTSLVYILQNIHKYDGSWMNKQGEIVTFQVGDMYFPLENIPRIEQQIELLATYSFFSEQEKEKALQNLALLKNIVNPHDR